MQNETVFRLILLAGFLAMTVIGLYYRLKADTGEKIDRRQEGAVIFLGMRSAALAFFAGAVAWIINPQWMAWSSLPLPDWLRWTGVALAGLSLALKTWTFHSLGRNLTDTVVTRKEHSLVTEGPYHYVRHPFYTSFAMDVVGVSLTAADWFLLLSGTVVFAFLVVRTNREEEKLIERFQDRYKDYMQHVGRFLPRIG